MGAVALARDIGRAALGAILGKKIDEGVNGVLNAGSVHSSHKDDIDASSVTDFINQALEQTAAEKAEEAMREDIASSNREKAIAMSDERLKEIEYKAPDVPDTTGARDLEPLASRDMEDVLGRDVTERDDAPITTVETKDVDGDGRKDLVVQEVVLGGGKGGRDVEDAEVVTDEPSTLQIYGSHALVPSKKDKGALAAVRAGGVLAEYTPPRSSPPSDRGMSELNKALMKSQLLNTLGKSVGGIVGLLGSAGAVGAQKVAEGQTLGAQIQRGIESTTGSMAAEQRHALARTALDKERSIADSHVKRIEHSSELSAYEKERAIRDVERSYSEESERILRALGVLGTYADRSERGMPMPNGTTVPSDGRVKNVRPSGRQVAAMLRDLSLVLSDEDYKTFEEADPNDVAKGIMSLGAPYSGSEMQFLHELAKHNVGADYDYDISDVGIWSPETLDGFARYIKNSVYTYKPEAMLVDPTIDPTERHVGPMAQEIEKVVPAAIVETPEGVKTVDTDRLGLTTAGVAADLARQNKQQGNAIATLMQEVRNLKMKVGA
jgi:hypothetical protein